MLLLRRGRECKHGRRKNFTIALRSAKMRERDGEAGGGVKVTANTAFAVSRTSGTRGPRRRESLRVAVK